MSINTANNYLEEFNNLVASANYITHPHEKLQFLQKLYNKIYKYYINFPNYTDDFYVFHQKWSIAYHQLYNAINCAQVGVELERVLQDIKQLKATSTIAPIVQTEIQKSRQYIYNYLEGVGPIIGLNKVQEFKNLFESTVNSTHTQ